MRRQERTPRRKRLRDQKELLVAGPKIEAVPLAPLHSCAEVDNAGKNPRKSRRIVLTAQTAMRKQKSYQRSAKRKVVFSPVQHLHKRKKTCTKTMAMHFKYVWVWKLVMLIYELWGHCNRQPRMTSFWAPMCSAFRMTNYIFA
ncbi:unnamed protein product [Amoebophrya sp. A120]|nr:unnamed protein product [Amoebophrya sp. A120]|eukprot:GSA120T00013607001.1